jgi:hypothetical protein
MYNDSALGDCRWRSGIMPGGNESCPCVIISGGSITKSTEESGGKLEQANKLEHPFHKREHRCSS